MSVRPTYHAAPEGHKDNEDYDVRTSPILYRIGKLRFLIGILKIHKTQGMHVLPAKHSYA